MSRRADDDDEDDTSLRGLRILVTGVTGGIGHALLDLLAKQGAILIAHARNRTELDKVTSDLEAPEAVKDKVVADLSSLAEAARLADDVAALGSLDVLVHNAGVGFGSDRKKRETSRDGFELRLAVNYLAPFVITEQLRSRVVINVASIGQAPIDFHDLMCENDYDGVLAYRRSKLALIMDTFERSMRDPNHAYLALHPGTFLDTKMVRDAKITPLGTAASGAEVIISAIKRGLAGETNKYFNEHSEAKADLAAYDEASQKRLRQEALKLTHLVLG